MQTKPGLYNKERQQKISELVKEKGTVSVQELADLFLVSTATIRADLTILEHHGELTRTHGGAMPKLSVRRESAISERENEDKKALIASYASHLVDNHENIFIDTGTTTMFFAKELAKQAIGRLCVYTNDIEIARILEENPDIELHLLGGKIRNNYHYTYGENVIKALQGYHFHKVFLTTSALDIHNGLTATEPHLSELKKQMIESSEEVILLADSTKVGQVCFQKFGELSEIDHLIMDDGLGAKDKNALSHVIPKVSFI